MQKSCLFLAVVTLVLVMAGCGPSVTVSIDKDVVAVAPGNPDGLTTAAEPIMVTVEPLAVPNVKVKRQYDDGYDGSFTPVAGVGTRSLTIADDISPGTKFIIPFPVINGKDGDKLIHYYLRIPALSEIERQGNEPLSLEWFSWLSNTSGDVKLRANAVCEIPVGVTIPKDIQLKPGTYELKAGVKDVTGPGFVKLAPEVTWYVVVP